MYKYIDLIADINILRPDWLGHINRIDLKSLKLLLINRSDYKGRKGGPRRIHYDLRNVGIGHFKKSSDKTILKSVLGRFRYN